MAEVIVFSGTTEGRLIQEFLKDRKIETLVFVATEYGSEVFLQSEEIKVLAGRLDFNNMKDVFQKEKPKIVIDATHPFAKEVTNNIRAACAETSVEYIRFIREKEEGYVEGALYVQSMLEAAKLLNERKGNALITTGSKDIATFTDVKGFEERFFPRILPIEENLSYCLQLGFKAKNIICMQGPFSQKANEAMLEFASAKYLITKETGKSGGFSEKIDACRELNVIPIIVGRPKEDGFSFEEVKERLWKTFGIRKKAFIIGGGVGTREGLTLKAINAIEESSIIITTKRLFEGLKIKDKIWFDEYNPKRIKEIIEKESFEKAAVIFSGDISFFSGAKEMRKLDLGCETEYISGISSISEFMNKAGKTYENVKTISLHGRNENFIVEVLKERAVFLLLGGENTAQGICKTLCQYGLGNARVTIGENLGGEDESLSFGKAMDFSDKVFSKLSVILIENENPVSLSYGLDESCFIRGNVPMTKAEVRAVSLSKLRLKKDSVVYDIGAGTGSVSCEIGRISLEGKVFAIEREPEGIDLIEKNKLNLGTDNVFPILGSAPECMKDLPVPTHVFIGGSGGNLRGIIDYILKKNPLVGVVVNAISLETVSTLLEILKENKIENYEIVNLNVSRNRRIGKNNLMEGQNPIYIISFTRKTW